jgi:hypothetical protein
VLIASHPERSSHVIEGPLERVRHLNAARHFHNSILVGENSLALQIEHQLRWDPSTALAALRDANFAQDDKATVAALQQTRCARSGSQA